VTIGGELFRLTANERADGTLGEVFIHWGKQGTTGSGLMDMYATALSVGLRHGVPLASLVKPALGLYCVPNGHTDDPEIPRVRSVIDYFARRLAVDWLPQAERASLGVFTISERIGQADRDAATPKPPLPPASTRGHGDTSRLLWELATRAGTRA
jgi:ribonucleoside-diphosphate reductase alpha chain